MQGFCRMLCKSGAIPTRKALTLPWPSWTDAQATPLSCGCERHRVASRKRTGSARCAVPPKGCSTHRPTSWAPSVMPN
jgi:hypothetical protein